jgi:hypothetical protein
MVCGSQDYGRSGLQRDFVSETFFSLELVSVCNVASLTGGDRSIGIVRLRTKNHGVFFYPLQ